MNSKNKKREWENAVKIKQIDEVLDRIYVAKKKHKEFIDVNIALSIDGEIAPYSKNCLKQIKDAIQFRKSNKKRRVLKIKLITISIIIIIGIIVYFLK